jgi:hypothetical protein
MWKKSVMIGHESQIQQIARQATSLTEYRYDQDINMFVMDISTVNLLA